MELTFSPTDTSKYIYVCNDSHRTSAEHWQKSSGSQKRKSPSNWVRQKKKKKKTEEEIGMGSAPLGGRCEGGKVSTHWEVPSLVGTERELWSLGGERSSKRAESKAERDLHRAWVPTHTSQPEKLVRSPSGAGGG